VREPQKVIRVLTPEEVGKLLAACPSDRWRAFIALVVTTGMRRGELLALRWEDVDFEGRAVHVRNTADHPTKARKNRVLALLPQAAELMGRLARRGELVFTTRDGMSMVNNVQRDFYAIVKNAGIKRCTAGRRRQGPAARSAAPCHHHGSRPNRGRLGSHDGVQSPCGPPHSHALRRQPDRPAGRSRPQGRKRRRVRPNGSGPQPRFSALPWERGIPVWKDTAAP
jgi:hypothetical protein